MKLSLRNIMAGLGTALFLAACGGGGGGGSDVTSPTAKKPTAVAAADQTTVEIGTKVTLNGSGSSAANGGSLAYQWALASVPGGSAATLSSATDASPSFTPDLPGEYVADLQVRDSAASSEHARVTIKATNPNPVAIISPATQGVLLGSTVVLDGSPSLAPTGANASGLSYQWTLAAQPDGTATTLASATSARASFTAEKVGIYKATLLVTHGGKTGQAEATITVSTSNSAPVANIALPSGYESDRYKNPIIKAVRGQTVTLDGRASNDPDGDNLHYRWSIPSALEGTLKPRPLGSSAAIQNANSAQASFTPDAAGTYYIDFTVYDASVATTRRVAVQASKPEGAANTAPVAVISPYALEAELGGYAGIDGKHSYDIDGDALTYNWTWWSTAAPGARNTAIGSYLNLGRTLAAGTYQVELTVNDGQASSATISVTYTVKIGANIAPTPVAKVDIARVLVGEPLVFDASASTDRNGDPIRYQWTLVDRPDGSSAVLQNATSAQARVVTDKPGVYTARVQVSDPKGAVGYATVYDTVSAFAKAKNNAPVIAKLSTFSANDCNGQEPAPGQPFILNSQGLFYLESRVGLQVFDPDQDFPLDFLVTPTRQPANEIPAVAGLTASGACAAPYNATTPIVTRAGVYEFEAIVSDGLANSAPVRSSLTVVNRADYPTLLLEEFTGLAYDSQGPGGISYQAFFPYRMYSAGVNIAYGGDVGLATSSWYRLTAFDRDYTIIDLQTSSTDNAMLPKFTGLQNGQVIRKGQSVDFKWQRPLLPNESQLHLERINICNQYGSSSAECTAINKQLADIIPAYQFKSSFRIAEKPEYTFRVGD